MDQKRICILTTMSSSIDNWIKPFLNEYKKINVKVTIICNMSEEYANDLEENYENVDAFAIDFPRGNSLLGSVKSILKLIKLFKKNGYDMVQYSTPNASVYGSIASWICKVPVRLYCQWGMIYVTQTGIKRFVYKLLEKNTCKLSTNIQPDSFGNLNYCREHGLYDVNKSEIIWNGSAKGIDCTMYDISKKMRYSTEIRDKYNIPADAIVIGFVGRLGKEKGCNELFEAFKIIEKQYNDVYLLFVGPIEKENTIAPNLLAYFKNNAKIIKTNRVSNVEKYISAMDIFVLPSYREGFGMSVVEAEVMEVPVIVTEYPGPIGGMIPNETGLTIPIKNINKLVETISYLINNPKIRLEMGSKARVYAVKAFDRKIFIKKYMENRKKLLGILDE